VIAAPRLSLEIYVVRNEEVAGSIPVSSTKLLCFAKAGCSIRLSTWVDTMKEISVPNVFGTLIDHDGDLKLVSEGEVFRPGDELRGVRPEVMIAEPQKPGADRAVRRWNDHTDADVKPLPRLW